MTRLIGFSGLVHEETHLINSDSYNGSLYKSSRSLALGYRSFLIYNPMSPPVLQLGLDYFIQE